MNPPDLPDVYTNTEQDNYPGARVRSKPGEGPGETVYDMIPDANGRLVSGKPSNRAILSAQRKRKAHQELQDSLDRERRSRPSSSSGILRTILLLAIFLPLLSNFLTSSWTFNLYPRIQPRITNLWRTSSLNPNKVVQKVFTPDELGWYDGTEGREIYLAIDGEVYDVSAGRRMYGKGGSYNVMAGRDASRSFVTGCFETHRTHDLRGLSPTELEALQKWKSFFANHAKYFRVGAVMNPPIDPSSPIPPDCRDTSDKSAVGATHASSAGGGVVPGPVGARGKGEGEL